MSDPIERAAEVIFKATGRRLADGTIVFRNEAAAEDLHAEGLLVTPAHDAVVAARAWDEGHAAGRDYQADGWNSDAHDPAEDNPYREGASHE